MTRSVLVLMILLPEYASANCSLIASSLKIAMKEYRVFRDQNQELHTYYSGREASCHARGASISLRAGESSAALTCTALGDMRSLQTEITSLSTECTTIASEVHKLQTELVAKFRELKTDLDKAVATMRKETILHPVCAKEIELAGTMAEAFLGLERKMISLREQSNRASADFGGLQAASSQLAAASGGLEANCGQSAEAKGSVSSTQGRGAAAFEALVVPAGRSPASASDITGTKENELKARETEKALAP